MVTKIGMNWVPIQENKKRKFKMDSERKSGDSNDNYARISARVTMDELELYDVLAGK
jgi:hypothetical protein